MNDPRATGSQRNDHEVFDELAVGWALHALEPEDETFFAAHLPACPRCRRTVTETAEVMGALSTDLPLAQPSEGLRRRLRAAVDETEQVPPALPEERPATPAPAPSRPAGALPFPDLTVVAGGRAAPRTPWRRVLPSALVAAAVAAILGLGTWTVVLGSARDEARTTLAEQSEIVQELLRPGQATIAPLSDDDGDPVATVVAREDQVQVVTHGLAANDAQRETYVVWGMGGSGPVPLGTFDVSDPHMDMRTVGSSAAGLDDYAAYGISREPGRQAPPTPTVVVATGGVTS